MVEDELIDKAKHLYRVGLARFLFLAINYMKGTTELRKKLEKKDLYFRLVLEATDWPNPAVLLFKDHELLALPISPEDAQNPDMWDMKVIGEGQDFLEYFMGGHAIIPILLGKVKVKGMLKSIKVLWFINLSLDFFSTRQTFSRATFSKLYQETRVI
ncbi:MAG: hypothetical protein ACOC44_03890 [Promethearchaeia archaeon]